MGLGPVELLVVLAIVLLVFGGRRLPQLGRQLGGGLREFKESVVRRTEDADDESGAALPPAVGSRDADDAPLDGEVVRDSR